MKTKLLARWQVRVLGVSLLLALMHMHILGHVWRGWSNSRFCDVVAAWFVGGALIGTMVSGGSGGQCEAGFSYGGGLIGVWLFYFAFLLIAWTIWRVLRKFLAGRAKPTKQA